MTKKITQEHFLFSIMVVLAVAITVPACLEHLVWADTLLPASPVPSASGFPVSMVPATDSLSLSQWLQQVFTDVKLFGGMTFILKLSAIITLVIASIKVSVLRSLVWDKYPALKGVMAPLLSLLVGIIALAAGKNLSFATAAAYVFSGSGAIIFHEFLDSLKAIPGISPAYLSMIEFFTKILGGPNPLPADTAIPAGMGTAAVPSANPVTPNPATNTGFATVAQSNVATAVDADGTVYQTPITPKSGS